MQLHRKKGPFSLILGGLNSGFFAIVEIIREK